MCKPFGRRIAEKCDIKIFPVMFQVRRTVDFLFPVDTDSGHFTHRDGGGI